MTKIHDDSYSNQYNQKVLIEKLKKNTVKAGQKLVYTVLLLYYTLQKDNVPLKVKATIIGALGYFIAPFDAIPDFLPMIGYTDDFGALMMALAAVSMYIDSEVKNKAKTQLASWFGEASENDIDEINGKL
ncbi:YkvA family protein [Pelosinus sp. sgz500959]|uniref:YkvA family protein n=1 Tax=Pelosinus sp. sgz500959 TaxID=3242472 RepID=UPI0036732C25